MRRQRPDRRVERSRAALQEAMIALILEKGFDEITVMELTERANVGRSTFYEHFDNKEDLLLEGFDRLSAMLAEAQRQAPVHPHPCLAFSRPMLEHARDHRALFAALVGRRRGSFVEEQISLVLARFVREGLAVTGTSLPPAAVVESVVGAYLGVMRWWLLREPEREVEEVDAVITRLVLPVLDAATGGAALR